MPLCHHVASAHGSFDPSGHTSENEGFCLEMVAVNQKSWWNGTRGEWLVVTQVALIALVFFGPRTMSGQPGTAVSVPARVPNHRRSVDDSWGGRPFLPGSSDWARA